MALSPQKFREIVLQLLYSQDIAVPDEQELVDLLSTELEVSKRNVRLAQERVQKIKEKFSDIDNMISETSSSYQFDRIHKVSKNILRLALYEIFFDDSIPPKVAIAEAIRLSRKFSNRESASFVNAVLDYLYKKDLGIQTDPALLHEQIEVLEKNDQFIQEEIEQHLTKPVNKTDDI